MVAKIRSGLTYANVMATVAVFLALGGGAYAAVKLPRASVGSRQIQHNAVTSSKVKDHSLLARDFRAGQLPAGPKGDTGAQGAPGTPGAPGASLAFAHVNSDGSLIPGASSGISSATKTHTGEYCFVVRATPTSAVASGDANEGGVVIAETNLTPGAEITSGFCPQGTNAIVLTFSTGGMPTDHAFFVVFGK
jgi:hypothetical protein